MEQAKKHRTVLRASFTKAARHLEQVRANGEADPHEKQAAWEILSQKYELLQAADKEVYELMWTQDVSEDLLSAEIDSCDEYLKKYTLLKVTYSKERNIYDEAMSRRSISPVQSEHSVQSNVSEGMRRFKLPTIEFKKFSGNVHDWQSFWGQFKKIDKDVSIDISDKFQYLIQATLPGSRARELVESFPPIDSNYEKVIDSLKSRFGREDLQIEVFVRELLKLVLNNVTNDSKLELSVLYDKLETQLRALDTLGVTTDKCAAILFPLIESCLPQDLLRAWQRSPNFCKTDPKLKDRLEGLMQFLKTEVEGEERINLAAEGFNLSTSEKSIKKNKVKTEVGNFATAAGLINCDVAKCIFCTGSHVSDSCFKAQKYSLEQKRNLLAQKKACFKCMKAGHLSRKCRERVKCVICGNQHAVLMCPDLPANKRVSKDSEPKTDQVESKELANHTNTQIFLQTLRVRICSDRGVREIRAIIDSGSQRSYVLKSTVEKLEYSPICSEKIVHSLFGGGSTREQLHQCYRIKLLNLDGNYSCTMEVLDQPTICSKIPAIYPGIWNKELRELNINITDMHDAAPVELLIGADVAGKLYTGRRHILQCGLVAVETCLGWTLMGKINESRTCENIAMTSLSLFTTEAPVSDLWQLDVLGIADPGENKKRAEMEAAAKEAFEQSITRDNDGRYEVRLPWIEGHPPVPENYALAKKRLESTVKKLRYGQHYDSYNNIFDEWLQEEIIEEVPLIEVDKQAHYLPHRAVVKESSLTTKKRPVFDASAKEKGKPSLNQCLEKGSNLIELIPSILLRFRQEQIGVISDIKKAFLQISIDEKDRDFLRFLWLDKNGEEKIYRHRRVVFGVNSSPFLLGATIEHHLQKSMLENSGFNNCYSPEIIKKLSASFYVDNCVTSVPDENALKQFITEASAVMAEGKFELRGWEHSGTHVDDHVSTPVLGLTWNLRRDTLALNAECMKPLLSDVITKRLILSLAQRVFDPIGFTCPATLLPKLLLQKTWECKLSWDAPVDDKIKAEFIKWFQDLSLLNKIEIPRWICDKSGSARHCTFHTFCDASKDAYAAAVFLRVELQGDVKVFLLAAKSRVAPLKKITIPRLELLGATIGARLFDSVQKNFYGEYENYFWSDSTTTLAWIKRSDEWATFVWNRTQEIRSLTAAESWRYVPGALNPADLPSRGCTAGQLLESHWWEGPRWLYGPSGTWPVQEFHCDEEVVCQERKKKLVTTMLDYNSDVWHLTYFSKYEKTIRMMGWIQRFLYNTRKRNRNNKRQGELTTEEVESAEKLILKIVQQESFGDELNKQITSLSPVTDEFGLIRLKTKVLRREDTTDFRFPILLNAKHPVVQRLIFDYHRKSCHVGAQGLTCLLREKYWLLGGRRVIRSIISKCTICRRHKAKPMNVETPPLNVDRVRDAVVFEVTGVDFAGPLFLKGGQKSWICLFTCAIYRAVHLELTTSLSTHNFMQALRRFVARCGRPKIIYSDNGTNFVGAENAFKQLDWNSIINYSAVQRITWRFNPPTAAWWGGFWERLVGVVKQLLRRVLGRASLDYEELCTILCDCEAIVNARPLTSITGDPEDLVPLTPALFLRDQAESGVPDCDAVDRDSLNRRMKYKQQLRDHLRRRFRSEYLGQLRQLSIRENGRPIALNEIVLIGSDNEKRMGWPLGRVIELIPGKDGNVRLIRVKTARGQLLRPVQRVYPLECDALLTKEGEMSTTSARVQKVEKRVSASSEKSRATSARVSDREDHTSVVKSATVTRSGRIVKTPAKYN